MLVVHYVSPRNKAFWEAGQIALAVCQRGLITSHEVATRDRASVTCAGCNEAMRRRDRQHGATAPHRADTHKRTGAKP